MDVVAEFACVLPVRVICSLLGLPVDESDTCRGWAEAISRGLEPFPTEGTVAKANTAVLESSEYLRGHIASRRSRPGDELLSSLLAAEEAGDRLTEAELVSTVNLLFFAGHFTTRDLIANGVLALLHAPGELQRLRSDPAIAARAAEELLRFDNPTRWCLGGRGRISRSGDAPSPAANRSRCCWVRPTATPNGSPSPTGWTSGGPMPRPMSPSAAGLTSASAPP